MQRKITVLGSFDGVHLGHKALLDRAVSLRGEADLRDCKITVWTFDGTKDSRLMPNEIREGYLRTFGADEVLFADFQSVRGLTPREFVSDILIDRLNSDICICGFNYRFGKNAEGDCNTLRQLLSEHGRRCEIADAVYKPPLCAEVKPISSTEIRLLIARGDIDGASLLLGHPFIIRSEVVRGKQLGRQWGFPTANQKFLPLEAKPQNGVYATFAIVGEKLYPSVTNVGLCPTVSGEGTAICETHIIGFDGDLYGKMLTVGFLTRLRDEKKFENETALRFEIEKNRTDALKFFSERRDSLILPIL